MNAHTLAGRSMRRRLGAVLVASTLATGAMAAIGTGSPGAMTKECTAAFKFGRYAIGMMDSTTGRERDWWHAVVDENNEWISNNC